MQDLMVTNYSRLSGVNKRIYCNRKLDQWKRIMSPSLHLSTFIKDWSEFVYSSNSRNSFEFYFTKQRI